MAHPEGQRDRPVEAPATGAARASRADEHGANCGPGGMSAEDEGTRPLTLTAATAATTSFDLGPARALSGRECGHEIPLAAEFACPQCFGPLEVAYAFGEVTRASIEAGPKSIWRYRQLLPVPADVQRHHNTEPGLTRLIKADRLAAAVGVRSLWVKDDT